MNKINFAVFGEGRRTTTVHNLWQWNYGQILRIQGLDLPTAVEIHFSLQETGGKAAVKVGVLKEDSIEAEIPNFIFTKDTSMNYRAYAFVYPEDESSGKTAKKIILDITARPKPEDYVHTDDEVLLWKDLDERITKIEENGGGSGKSAYEYAVEAGYTGTEEEFAEKLADENSGINVTGAEVGQMIIVSEVDESGKPTAWESVDTPVSYEEMIPKTDNTTIENLETMIPLNTWESGEDILYCSWIYFNNLHSGHQTEYVYKYYEFSFTQTMPSGIKRFYTLTGEGLKNGAVMLDDRNYKSNVLINGSLVLYFIADLSTLTEEYSGMFTQCGVYIWCNNASVASQVSEMKSMVYNYYGLDAKYIPSSIARTDNVLELDNDVVFTPTSDYHPATKKYVDENKGVSSWNDLEDKPFYEEITEGTVLIEEQEVSFSNGYESNGTMFFLSSAVEEGNYILELDGEKINGVSDLTAGIPQINFEDGGFINMHAFQIGDTTFTGTKTVKLYAMTTNVKQIDEKYLPEIKQPDWGQNDETASDYIKGRPFYKTDGTYVIEPTQLTFAAGSSTPNEAIDLSGVPTGSSFDVQWVDNVYECIFSWNKWSELWDFNCSDSACPFSLDIETNNIKRKNTEVDAVITFAVGQPLPKYIPIPGEYFSQFKGATTEANGEKGMVPTPLIGEQDKVLLGSGVWGHNAGSLIKVLDNTDTYVQDNISTHIRAWELPPGLYIVRGTITFMDADGIIHKYFSKTHDSYALYNIYLSDDYVIASSFGDVYSDYALHQVIKMRPDGSGFWEIYSAAGQIIYDDTETQLGATNVQKAIGQLSEQIADYLPKNQGAENVGKILVVGTDGNLTLTDMPEGGVSGDVIGTLDESNNILLSGSLADGTYVLKYENTDGTYTEIGNLVVGKAGITNLADSTDASWVQNGRVGSDGTDRTDATGKDLTNYIPVTNGDVVRVKNFDIQTGFASGLYNASKGIVISQSLSLMTDYLTNINLSGEIETFTINHADVKFVRLCGISSLTDADVIITVNEEIV